MLKSKLILSITLSFIFFIIASNFPLSTAAQTRPVSVAPGFELNLFADPTNVPEFAASAFSGPTAMAFDARGRLFVGTYSGKILILLDNNEDGRAEQVKTFANGISIPLGLTFRANGDLYVTSNLLGGVGRIIAPVWAGFAYDHLGTGVPFFTSAAVVLATLLLGVGLEQFVRPPATA